MFNRFVRQSSILIGLFAIMFVAARDQAGASPPETSKQPRWSAADLLGSPAPFALGHRGYGINTGEDPNRPLENTLDAFRQAFQAGVRVDEMDLQRTADGKIVVYHDDYLEDFTCVSALTYAELLARKPQVPLFRTVLNSMRHFDRADALSGILFVEIKVPIPLCDGANTSEAAEASEASLVADVLAEIHQSRREDQVILNSESPTILRHVAEQAPGIARALSLNVLQMLPPEQVAEILQMPVVLIPKNDFGLSWYNIGPIARLPGFPSIETFVGVSLAIGSQAVSLDKIILLQAGDQAPYLLGAMHSAGLKAMVWTIDTLDEWSFVAQAGADGITTNNIPLGLAQQAPLTTQLARIPGSDLASAGVVEFRLALEPPRSNPSLDGRVRVDFVLPDAAPAHVGLYDVAGRLVESRDVTTLGAGRHGLTLGEGLRAGVYLVRLSHGDDQRNIKAVVAH